MAGADRGAARTADRYIARDGGPPAREPEPVPRPPTPPGHVLLTNAEYRRLLVAAELDDTLIWCEVCGAWLDHNDPAVLIDDDFRGCRKVALGSHPRLCRSYRAPDRKPVSADMDPRADLRTDDGGCHAGS